MLHSIVIMENRARLAKLRLVVRGLFRQILQNADQRPSQNQTHTKSQ
jgi:hypothetical protein